MRALRAGFLLVGLGGVVLFFYFFVQEREMKALPALVSGLCLFIDSRLRKLPNA
ncbi:MAG: hypothetical protein H7222_15200 [Methylotenera sp.]|nr:hypothetical protein [Oligoflexia bacterium]